MSYLSVEDQVRNQFGRGDLRSFNKWFLPKHLGWHLEVWPCGTIEINFENKIIGVVHDHLPGVLHLWQNVTDEKVIATAERIAGQFDMKKTIQTFCNLLTGEF